MTTKTKVSVTIDSDLVAALQEDDDTLSAQVNAAVRDVVERRRRQAALAAFLDELWGQTGPPDEDRVAVYMDMLR